MAQESNNKTFIIITSILGFAVMAMGAYIFYLTQQKNEQLVALTNQKEEIQELDTQNNQLQTDLDTEIEKLKILSTQYDDLKLDKSKLDSLLIVLENDRIMWQNRSLLSQNEMKTLEQKLKNTILSFEKEREALTKEMNELKETNIALEEKNSVLKSANDSLIAENNTKELINKEIFKKASRLKIENLKIAMLSEKNKPITKTPYKSSQIGTINAVFNLSKNDIAQKGKRTMVMRIEKPDGGILYDASANGNTFKTANYSQSLYYTVSKNVNYNNNYEEITLTYQKEADLISGFYKVKIYLDGEETGSTTFEIK
jgi:cell division protein FtsB